MLYGINWNTGSKKQVAQKSNKKKGKSKIVSLKGFEIDLQDIGYQEADLLQELMQAKKRNGFPRDFKKNDVKIVYDDNTGKVFFSNSDNQVVTCVAGKLYLEENDELGKISKKKTTTKNYIVEVKKRPDPKKWQQIDAMREKSQFDISDYGNVGKMLVYHIENDILGWRLYVKKTAETMKKFPEIEKVSGISKVKSNAQDLKLGALLIKQGKITKMPMPTLAKAIKRWHESGMQTKMEDFINNDMQKNSTAYKAKTKKKKAKNATTKNLKKQAKKKAKKKAKKVVSKKKIATKTRPAKKVSVKKKSQKHKSQQRK